MSFEWADYLELAKSLYSSPSTSGGDEAALRTATSRAYYAAYHLALEFARNEKYTPYHTGDDHQGLVKYYREFAADKLRKKLSTELDRMRDSRRQADYDTKLHQSPKAMADLTIKRAETVLQLLQSLV
jgi:uncharacterized protein (UPF0332 family)